MTSTRHFNDLEFDPSDGRLRGPGGRAVSLRPQASDLLVLLLDHPNEVCSRQQLAAGVWRDQRIVDFEAGLSALVRDLRQAIAEVGGDPGWIQTVPRRGYRLQVLSVSNDRADRSGPGRRRVILAAALFTSLAVLGSVAFWLWPAAGQHPLRLAVLPFVLYQDEVLQPQSELKSADAVLSALWEVGLPGVELIGRTSLAPYEGLPDAARRVGSELGADLIVEGSVATGSFGWRIELRLVRLPDGAVIWSAHRQVADGPPDVWAVARDLVDELSAVWPELVEQSGRDASGVTGA